MAYDLVPYTPALDAQISQLQTHLWHPDPRRNAAYLRWKYLDNPFLKDIVMRLALYDGQVVAMRGMFGAVWQVDVQSARHLLPYADDFVVAPAHRNSGLANQIMKAVIVDGAGHGFPYAVSLSAGPVTVLNSLATGWRSAGSYESAWRTHPGTTPSLMDRARTLARVDPRPPFDRLDREGRLSAGPVSVGQTPRGTEMAALIARLPWDGRIRHVRDAEYFAWRFRNPLHEYRVLFWDEGGRLLGYLALQRFLSPHANPAINIADWEGEEERVRAGLLRAAVTWGRFPRMHVWTGGMNESGRTLLRDQGFAAELQRSGLAGSKGLLIRRLGEPRRDEAWTLGSRSMLNLVDWDLRMLYSMAA